MRQRRPRNLVLIAMLLLFAAAHPLQAQVCPTFSSSFSTPDCNPSCTACPGDQITFSVTGGDLPDGGTIDWYEGTTPGFDPYLGAGTFIGSSAISTPGTAPCTDCPAIMAIMVDACGAPEGANEFMMISSGSGFIVSDLVLDFDPANNSGGPGSADVGITGGICNWGPGDPSLITGCSGVTIITPAAGDLIPAGATVLLQTSNGGSTIYDFSATCGSVNCIYVIRNSCTRGSFGGFSNCASSGLRNYEIYLNSCACSDIATIDTDAAFCSSGMGGDGLYFVPGAGFANDGCNIAPGAVAPPPTPTASTITDFVYNITATDCNQGPVYIVGIPNPQPSACCSDIYTDYFQIDVICPSANPGIDITVCDDGTGMPEFNLTSVDAAISGGVGTVEWFTDMAGANSITNTTNFPATNNTSVYAQVLNGCTSNIEEVTLLVSPSGTIAAGMDVTSCGNATISLTPTITPAGTAITWTTTGDGVFSNPNSPTTGYVPGLGDVAAGTVTLTLSPDAGGGCAGMPDDLIVTLLPEPTADAGLPSYTICSNEDFMLPGLVGGGSSGSLWVSFGDGTFVDPTDPNTTYSPGPIDIAFGTVSLQLTATAASSSCSDAVDLTTLNINASPLVSLTGQDVICGPVGTGFTYMATITGANGGIQWTTSGDGSFSNPTGTTTNYTLGPSAVVGSVITLTATVQSTNGCPATVETFNVTVESSAFFMSNFPTAICEGDNINLDFSADQPMDLVSWFSFGDGTFTDANALVTTYMPGPGDILAGNVTLQLQAQNLPCVDVQFNVPVDIVPEPELGLSSNPTSVCTGGTFSLTALELNANTDVPTWSSSGDGFFSSTSGNNTVYTPGAGDIAAGTVTINATSNSLAPNCNPVSEPIVLTITTGPTVSLVSPANNCGSAPIDLSATLGSGATVANWSSDGDGAFSTNPGTATQYTPGLADIATGSFTITVTTDAPVGCPPATDNVLINLTPVPIVSITGPDTICGGIGVGYEATVVGPSTGIVWSTSGNGSFSNPNGAITNYVLGTADVPGTNVTLTATVATTNGCPNVVEQIIVAIETPAMITSSYPMAICAGDDIPLTWTSDQTLDVIQWSSTGDGSFLNTNSLLNVYTPGPTDIANGSVALQIDILKSPCTTYSSFFFVTIHQSPEVTIDASPPAGCAGSVINLIATAQNANTGDITWSSSGDGTFTTNIGTVTDYTPSANDIANGTVTITTTVNPLTAFCDLETYDIVIPLSNAATATIVVNSAGCGSAPVDLTATLGGGATVANWSTDGDGSFDTNPGINTMYTPGATDINNGQFTISILTDMPAGGCPAATDDILVTLTPTPTVSIVGDDTLCVNLPGSYVATVVGTNTGITWTTSTDGTFTNPNGLLTDYLPGPSDNFGTTVTLTATVTTGNGCPPTIATIDVFIAGPNNFNTGFPTSICVGDVANLDFSSTQPIDFAQWTSAGDGTFDDANSLVTFYTPGPNDILNGSTTVTLMVTDSPCPGPLFTIGLSIIPAPSVSLSASPMTACEGQSIDLTAINGNLNTGNVDWTSGGDGSFTFSTGNNTTYTPGTGDNAAGTVTITATANSVDPNCSPETFDIVLTITDGPTGVINIDNQDCGSNPIDLSATLGGGASIANWSSDGDGVFSTLVGTTTIYTPGIADIASGQFTISIWTDSPVNGCPGGMDSQLITLSVPATVSASGPLVSCNTDDINLTAVANATAGIISWSSTGTGSFTTTVGLATTYTPSAADVVLGGVVITATTEDPIGPCPIVTDMVSITLNPAANAGTANPPLSFCSDETNTIVDLFGELNGADAVGTWTETSTILSTGIAFNAGAGTFDFGIQLPGTYSFEYTVTGVSPCQNDQETVVISIASSPVTTFTSGNAICNTSNEGSILDLTSLILTGDMTGIWDANGLAVNLTDYANVDFNTIPANTYIFTYTTNSAIAPCDNIDYPVTIVVEDCACPSPVTTALPNLCETDGSLDLSLYDLTAATGTWAITGTPAGGNPATISGGNQFNGLNSDPGTYELTYTLDAAPLANCPDSSVQTLQVFEFLEAGSDNFLSFCNEGAVDLNNYLSGADSGGGWQLNIASPNALPGGSLDALTGLLQSNLLDGTYIIDYVHQNTAPCLDDAASFTITVGNPVVDISGPATACDPASAMLSATAGFSTYSWSVPGSTNEITVSATGWYYVTIADVNQCESIDSFYFEELILPTGNFTGNYCVGDVVMVGTDTYDSVTSSGTTTLPGAAANSCDSLVMVNLTFTQQVTLPPIDTMLCPGESITVNGTVFDAGNLGGQVIFNTSGCDSLQNVTIGFLTIPTGNFTGNYCVGDVVMVGTDIYDSVTSSGTTTLPGQAANGCDSLVSVNLTFTQQVTLPPLDTMLCPGESITVNGTVFDAGNLGGQVIFNTSGCDSLQNVTIGFLTIPTGNFTGNYCVGDVVMVGTDIYDSATSSGTTTLSGQAANGCDSLVSVNLTFTQQVTLPPLDTMLCPGESITVNGTVFDAGNLGGQVIFNTSGCDSLQNVSIQFLTIPTGNFTGNYCVGDVVMVGTDIYDSATSSGTTTLPGQAANGCDSLVSVNLTFTQQVTLPPIDTMLCPGESITVNGTVFDAGNLGGQVIFNTSGCDSFQNVTIGFLTIPTGNFTGNYCVGDVVMVGTDTYDSVTSSGTTTLPGAAANSCDSLVMVNLTFTQQVTLPPIDTMLCPGESITVNGTVFDAGNLGGQVIFNTSGCDSLQNVTIGFLTIPTGNFTGNYCVGDVVMVGTDIYDSATSSGTTTLLGQAANGCDSLVSVNLTFTQQVTLPPLDTMLCPGESITVNGTVFDAGNLGGQVIFNTSGCDSLQNVSIQFLTIPTGNFTGNYCVGDVVMVGTDVYDSGTSSGTTTLPSAAANGCDSLVSVNLTFTQQVTLPPLDTMLCPGESITVNGTVFDAGNLGGQVIFNTSGCDSLQNVSIQFLTIPTGNFTGNYCVGDVVMVGTDIYDSATSSGTTTLPGQAANGCDSLVSVNLTFTQQVTLPPIDTMLCPGESITVNGTVFDTGNLGGQVIFNTSGCDSLQNVTIGFLTIPTGNFTGNYCVGDVVMVGTDIYDSATSSGTTTLPGQAANGCDSLVSVNLTFTQQVTLPPIDTMLCPGESITVNGTVFDTGNLGGQVIFNTSGCDSLQNVTIGFLTIPTGNFTGNYCVGDVVMVGTDIYDSGTSSGTTTLPGQAANGCDSLVNVNLTFSQLVILPAIDTILCPGQSLTVNNITFDSSNPSGQVLFDNSGCDSTQMVLVNFAIPAEGNYVDQLCEGDVFMLGNDIYDMTTPIGQTVLTGASQFGCDSTVNVNLTFVGTITASINSVAEVCENESAEITFTFSTAGLFDAEILVNGTLLTLNDIQDGHIETVPISSSSTIVLNSAQSTTMNCAIQLPLIPLEIDVSTIDLSVDVISDFGINQVSCETASDGVVELVSSGTGNFVYEWSTGTAPNLNQLSAGQYSVTIIDDNACRDSTDFTLTAPPAPSLDLSVIAPNCPDEADGFVLISDLTGNTNNFEYSVDGNSFAPITQVPFVVPNLSPGTFDLTVADDNGCSVVESITVDSPLDISSTIQGQDEIMLGDSVQLLLQSNFSPEQISWNNHPSISCIDCDNPYVSPSETTTYYVELIDSAGCTTTALFTLRVRKPDAFIPNAFSPNGDGANDWFFIQTEQDRMEIETFIIVDRWGEIVFTANDPRPNIPTLGWDGNLKGKPMNPGVFVYYASLKLKDGTELTFKGDITLIR